jgi:hypothetical protein
MSDGGQIQVLGVEPVRWPEQADEWLSRIAEAFSEVEGQAVRGSRIDGTTGGWLETQGVTAEGVLDTRLVTRPIDGGVLVAVQGSAEMDIVAADAWAVAVRLATERLGGAQKDFEWTALLGPPPDRIGSMEAIFGEAIVGPFRVSCPEKIFSELVPKWGQSLGAVDILYSWPMLVEGRHAGYNWAAASTAASMGLHQLCALFSVGVGMVLIVRDPPALREHGVRGVDPIRRTGSL